MGDLEERAVCPAEVAARSDEKDTVVCPERNLNGTTFREYFAFTPQREYILVAELEEFPREVG
jgi:hypothetical protein